MFKDATRMVRDYIVSHGEEFHQIVTDPSFTEYFTLLGIKLINIPKGYDPEHPYGEYLKYKCWFVEFHLPDEAVENSESFLATDLQLFERTKFFNIF